MQHVGEQIDRYRLLRFLGQGSSAQVYLGEHIHLGTIAAIKLFHERSNLQMDRDTMLAEVKALCRLDHPHIVRLLDYGIKEQSQVTFFPYIVMSYAQNGTLRQRHPVGTVVPLRQVVTYASQIADALQYAHTQNIVHGDVKPENMLVDKEDHILLSDFSVASMWPSTYTPETVAGTVMYMAPESLQGKGVPASDQYALSTVVYEWLSGSPPFTGVPGQIVFQQMSASVPLLTDQFPFIPKEIEQVVMKALNKDPKQRYSTVKEFATALEHGEKVAAMTQKKTDQAPEGRQPAIPPSTSYPMSPMLQSPTPTFPTIPVAEHKKKEDSEGLRQDIYGKLQTLSTEGQKEILIKAMGSLSTKDKNEVVQETGVRPLTQEATDFIWKVVVSGAVIVFVGSAVGIAAAVFVGANVAPLITVFTAAVAFLGGLLAPSPIQTAVRSISSGFKASSKGQNE